MIRYLVKTISKATLDNPNFAGQEMTAYYGKDQKQVACMGSHARAMHMESDFNDYLIEEYGYKRECDAKRSWIYKNPDNGKYWTTKAEIVQVVKAE